MESQSSNTPTPTPTSNRFDALRKLHDRSIDTDESKDIRFPLWSLLLIYEKAGNACGTDYMQGFKILAKWLNPIHTPTLIGEITSYESDILLSYETNQIAAILNIEQNIIIGCTVESVLPRLHKTI